MNLAEKSAYKSNLKVTKTDIYVLPEVTFMSSFGHFCEIQVALDGLFPESLRIVNNVAFCSSSKTPI